MEDVMLVEEDVPGAHFAKDPAEYSVLELKRWLECHGAKRTGKKQDLVDRVRGSIAIKKGIDPKVNGGKWYEMKKSGLKGKDVRKISKIPNEAWKNFPSFDIPSMFNYGHVYYYLVESISQFATGGNNDDDNDESDDRETGYTTTAKPLRKGMNLMKSDFISDIQDNKVDDSYFIRAHVHHSMKSEVLLNVMIELSSKASALGRCAQISALLLKVIDFVKNNGYNVNYPSTSKPCAWNTGKKRKKNPKAIHGEDYSSKKFPKSRIISFLLLPLCLSELPGVDQDSHSLVQNFPQNVTNKYKYLS